MVPLWVQRCTRKSTVAYRKGLGMLFVSKIRRFSMFFVALLVISTTAVVTAPQSAEAADYTFYNGSACHGVKRSEGTQSASLSRTGVYGWFGAPSQASRLTITFGTASTTFWSNEGQLNNNRSYGKGNVTPFFQNGVYGECANSNIGRLTGLTTGGMRIQPSEDPELFVVDTVDSDWTTSIQEADVKGSYIMTLKAGDYEAKGVFTKEQVESGTAIIEFQESPDQPVTRINYDPVEESFDAVDLVLQ